MDGDALRTLDAMKRRHTFWTRQAEQAERDAANARRKAEEAKADIAEFVFAEFVKSFEGEGDDKG